MRKFLLANNDDMTLFSRTSLKYLVSILLTGFFLFLSFQKTDVGAVYEAARNARYEWILAMLACLMLSHLVRAVRWRYLLWPIKHPIGLRNLFSGVMVGYFLNNFLPRAGEVARPYALGTMESIPKASVFGTIVVERILDILVFLSLLGLLPFFYQGPLRESFPWLEQASIVTTIATVSSLAFIVVLVFKRNIAEIVITKVKSLLPNRWGDRLEKAAHSFLDGFLFVRSPSTFLPILITSFLVWLLYVLMMLVAFWAFDFHQTLGFSAAIVVLAISSIGFAVPTPGGTGTYHFFTSQTLIKLFGVSDSLALSYATVTHAAGFFITTIIGLYFLIHDHVKVSKVLADSAVE
ncbi:MAG TPA: lysylphosphatidylglycerol synthase transmembrane domain-containing protein [Bacteroidota bacterium]